MCLSSDRYIPKSLRLHSFATDHKCFISDAETDLGAFSPSLMT